MKLISFTRYLPLALATPATPATSGVSGSGSGPTPLATYIALAAFNISSLPPDVLARYELNKSPNSIMTSADMTTFEGAVPNLLVNPTGATMRQVLYHQASPDQASCSPLELLTPRSKISSPSVHLHVMPGYPLPSGDGVSTS